MKDLLLAFVDKLPDKKPAASDAKEPLLHIFHIHSDQLSAANNLIIEVRALMCGHVYQHVSAHRNLQIKKLKLEKTRELGHNNIWSF